MKKTYFEKLPDWAILTGVSAMYEQRIATFKPAKPVIAIKHGLNSKKLANFNYSVQTERTINAFVINVNNMKMYSLERLFVEFELFSLENTIASAAMNNLLDKIDPFKVLEVFQFLVDNGRRGLNKNRIVEYLDNNLFDLEELILNNSNNISDLLREHVISELEKSNVTVLIKGGSAIELYIPYKRSTMDIDAHSGTNGTILALKSLANSKSGVYYKIIYQEGNFRRTIDNEDIDSFVKLNEKQIMKFVLIPQHEFNNLPGIEKNEIQVTFNKTYDDEEIVSIIADYKLSKQQLKLIKGRSTLLFSVDMLLAEKINALMSISQDTKRTKDLLDVFVLSNENTYDISKIIKWLLRKWESKRTSKTNEEAIDFIKNNHINEFPKIKDNFVDGAKMYDIKVTYDEALARYREICKQIIKQLEYKK